MSHKWVWDYDWMNPQTYFNRLWKDVYYPDRDDMNWNDYGSVQKYSTDPVFGSMFSNRMKQLEYEENDRFQKDKARNLGYSLEDVRYPIRSGLYGNYAGSGNLFEATPSIIGLYSDLMRWTKW